jgi:hypothetical protein
MSTKYKKIRKVSSLDQTSSSEACDVVGMINAKFQRPSPLPRADTNKAIQEPTNAVGTNCQELNSHNFLACIHQAILYI